MKRFKRAISLFMAVFLVVSGLPIGNMTRQVKAAEGYELLSGGELKEDAFQDLGGTDTWYLMGINDAWSFPSPYKFSRIADKLYATSQLLEAGTYTFKAATTNWGLEIGPYQGGNFTMTLEKKSKVNFYINVEKWEMWLSGNDETGNPLPQTLVEGQQKISLYNRQFDVKNWPRLVGTIQSALDGGNDWSPQTSTLFMYDYYMDGNTFKYETVLQPSTYQVKVAVKDDWGGDFGDPNGDGGNLVVPVSVASRVIFTADMTGKIVYADIIPLVVDIKNDFPLFDIPVDQKEFTFQFTDNVTSVAGKNILESISITPSVQINEVSIPQENTKELVVKLADTVTLEEDTQYQFTINEGYFENTQGNLNVRKEFSFYSASTETVFRPFDFIGLETIDNYTVAGNFQNFLHGEGDWNPSGTKARMKRVVGDLYAYSVELPESSKSYEFKVTKNGVWNNDEDYSNGGNNFSFKLDKPSVLTLFINAETRKIWSSIPIDGTLLYRYNPNKMPKLVGSIQELFGETSGDFDNGKQLFFDYYMDGSEYRLERKLDVTQKAYEGKLAQKSGGTLIESNSITVPQIDRPMDTTFVYKEGILTSQFNTYAPEFSIKAAPQSILRGSNTTLTTGFRNEFREMAAHTGVIWTIATPVEGVSIGADGTLKVGKDVPVDTEITIRAEFDYTTGFLPEFNKRYSSEVKVKVVPVVTDFKFNYLRHNKDYAGWGLWIWLDGKDGESFHNFSADGEWYTGVVSIPSEVTKLNFITKKDGWADQEGGDRFFDLTKGSEVWLVQGDKTVYYSEEEALRAKILTAVMTSRTNISFILSGNTENIDFSRFTVTANGKTIESIAVREGNTSKGHITIKGAVAPYENVQIVDKMGEYPVKTVMMRGILDSYYYNGDDLGYTIVNNEGRFKVWAPTAVQVSLALYKTEGAYNEAGKITDHTPDEVLVMTRDEASGVWSGKLSLPNQYKYYMYKVEFADGTYKYAVDPYAKAVSANGQRTAMVDLSATDPNGWDGTSKPSTIDFSTDHVIYELHVRDFSIDPKASFENKGKFLAFTETGLKDGNGNAIGIDHLKELGITTVHLLPAFDFHTVNELTVDDMNSANPKFNWGYDPQNFNVPEGSYSTNPNNPAARITEFKQMVQALHDADIRVVMDVVYNHTFDIANGPFEKIVPNYYYRMDDSLEFSNGSGCGNEVASEHPMVSKYIIDSVKYWAKEYNIDGFRFDLFELIDIETASKLTRELKEEIDPTILIYGEPWKAAASPIGGNGVYKGTQKDKGFAVFNDNIRSAIKGDSDNVGKGFATGEDKKEEAIVKGIRGSIDDFTNSPTETINYVTAHDNLNLWDKIITTQGLNEELNTLFHKIQDGVMKDGSSVNAAVAGANPYKNINMADIFANETVKRSLLANGMVLTMQGIPFIHAGDEFLRTKYGDHNSYKSPDSVNMIQWENVNKFKPVVDYYKGLMNLRQSHPAFRMNTKAAVEENLVVLQAHDNIIVYVLKNHANGDTWKNIVVIYNGTGQGHNLGLKGYSGAGAAGISNIDTWHVAVNDKHAGTTSLDTVNANYVPVEPWSMMVLYDEEVAQSHEVENFEISANEINLSLLAESFVQVIYKNAAGATLPKGNITVSSDNKAVADAVVTDTTNFRTIKVIGKGVGTATITVTVKKGNEDIIKTIKVNVVDISATINLATATSRQNPVLKVETGALEVSSIYADLTAVGGSNKYEVSRITKEISFGIKDYITEGIRTIPITVTDTKGKKYQIEAKLEVKTAQEGMNWDEAIIYFMLTDRFYDGNEANNLPNQGAFNKADAGAYHGGDFAGVTRKLDYLKELGVNTIWLTPIVENTLGNFTTQEELAKGNNYYSYHGYWATDFKALNPYLGTVEELHTLLDEAHARDMKIMVDVVLNHAGYYNDEHPLKDKDILNLLRDRNINENEERQWIAGLPDFDTENQAVRETILNWQLAWANLKTAKGNTIDYFRVDTVKHVDHETWKQFKTALAHANSEFKLIGEIFDGDNKINSYLNNGEMDSALDFTFNEIALEFVNGSLKAAEAKLEARNSRISNTAMLGQFLSSHDEDGFLEVILNGDKAKMMAAVTLQLTAKGQPVIYYGEEIGMSGRNNWPIYTNRYDFDWTLVKEENTTLSHYKKLLAARNEYTDAFAKGSRSTVAGGDTEGWLAFARSYQADEVYVVVNTKNERKEITFATKAEEGTVIQDIYSGTSYIAGKDGVVTVILPAMEEGGTVILPVKVAKETDTFYKVEFNSNGGSPVNAVTGLVKGSAITEPPAPTRGGYIFEGWYKDSAFAVRWNFAIDTVEADIILYAKWRAVTTPVDPNPSNPEGNGTTTPDVKEEKTSTITKGENDTTIETTTITKTDKDGNKTVEVIEVVKNSKGEFQQETQTITYNNVTNGVIIKVRTEKDKGHKVISQETVIEVTNTITSLEKDKSHIIVNLSEQISTMVEELVKEGTLLKETSITLSLSSKEIKEQAAEKKTKTIEIVVNGIKENAKFNIDSVLLNKDTLQAIKKSGKKLLVTVNDKEGKVDYQWSFDGTALKKSDVKLADVNLLIHAELANTFSKEADIKKLILKDKNNKDGKAAKGIVVSLPVEGLLPSTASIRIYVGKQDSKVSGIKANSTVYLYRYNEETKKLDILPDNKYKVGKDGYITIYANHGADYVILPKKAAKGISTDLLSQITVTSNKKTLSIGDSKKSIGNIKEVLPPFLVEVTDLSKKTDKGVKGVKITYKSDNKKAVTVNVSGKITAKGTGKAIITVTVTLQDGTKKSFKVPVTIKK